MFLACLMPAYEIFLRGKRSMRPRLLITKEFSFGLLITWSSPRLPLLKPHDPLITWPTGHVAILKIYISTSTRHMATKLSTVLTSRRRFSTQTFKSSPTSSLDHCIRLFLSLVFNVYLCTFHQLTKTFSKPWNEYYSNNFCVWLTFDGWPKAH